MFEFEVIQDLNPNDEILEIIKTYGYTVKNGKIKHLKATNLQFIEPTEYLITYPTTLTIYEYKVNEIANKPFYIKEHKQKYNLVETINNKNDLIKKEIENLNKKKQQIDPNNDYKEYIIELLKKLDCNVEDNEVMFKNRLSFSFIFESLNRKSKKELIKRLIDCIEIKRDKNCNIEITNIKFTEEFISKSSTDYIEYLYEILRNNNIGFIYKEAITKQELEKLQEDYFVFSNNKIANNEYDTATLTIYNELLKQNFHDGGIINCPYIENENIVDYLTLIPRIPSEFL